MKAIAMLMSSNVDNNAAPLGLERKGVLSAATYNILVRN